ncbi:MAG: hypothetical protein FJ009_00805 [Chloroflexi bacterium]|nr:hypothetical protein [Chloroflexota bacterium]
MPRKFHYTYDRAYGELQDFFARDLYAENLREALLLLVADFNDIYSQTEDEAKQLAEEWLNEELGKGWTVPDYFERQPELWTDGILYRIQSLHEANELKWESKLKQTSFITAIVAEFCRRFRMNVLI